MRKILLSLVILCLTLQTGFSTNVSGGIYSNTTWTKANSPYIVTDTIVVFPGVTLTIQPGVVVKFANGVYIELNQSQLIANGTKTDSITFTSNAASPTPGIWNYIYFYDNMLSQFNYCNFLYAYDGIKDYASNNAISIKNSNFKYNTNGIYDDVFLGQLNIDSSNFTHNEYGLNFPNQGGMQISNCNISNNTFGVLLYNISTLKKCTISNNTNYGLSIYDNDTVMSCSITNNGTGLICGSGSPISLVQGNIIEDNNIGIQIDWYEVTIICNKICNNTTYNLMGPERPSFGGSVTNNYWCSTDSAAIKSTIYDGYDNINYAIVPFMPIDTTQCYIEAGINNVVTISARIHIYPNPSNGIFTVTLSHPQLVSGAQTIEVYNVLGEKVYSQYSIPTTQYTLNLSNQPNGVYLYRVIANSGELIGEGKMIIQK